MKKGITIILILILVGGVGFFSWKKLMPAQGENTSVETSNQKEVDVKQLLMDVMENKKKLIDEEKQEIYLKELKIVENQTAEVEKYAYVDMDNDGVEELVIYTTSDYGAYVILHYENEKVYGYKIGVRSLENLKKDGSFMGSSGANSTEYLRMSFDKNTYTLKTEAIYDSTNKEYEINDETVTKKEIEKYANDWDKKEDIVWSK